MSDKELVFENFFPDPDKVRKFALSQKFFPKETHPSGGNWPGTRTPFYHTLSEKLYYEFTGRIYEVMGWPQGKESYFEVMFQLCTSKDGDSWVHDDKMDQDFTHVALIYLTPDPKPNSGTIIYDLKESANKKSKEYKESDGDPKWYDVRETVENVYNRCMIYNPLFFHKSDEYFGNDLYDGRLTLVAFIRADGEKSKFSQPLISPVPGVTISKEVTKKGESGKEDFGYEEFKPIKTKKIEPLKGNIASRFDSPQGQPTEGDLSIRDYDKDPKAWEEKYLRIEARSHEWELMADELGEPGYSNIFKWPLFNEIFCKEMIDLCETEGEWTEKRHEFYPTTDMLLDTVGINNVYEQVLKKHCYPAAEFLYALEGSNWASLTGENFIIKYIPSKQSHLSLHHDYSKLTFLANLNQRGRDFEGSGTYFRRQKILVQNDIGEVVMHPGNITHKHGARPTTSGTRYVIVSFCNTKDG